MSALQTALPNQTVSTLSPEEDIALLRRAILKEDRDKVRTCMLQLWKRSNLSKQDFCDSVQISLASFHRYTSKPNSETKSKKEPKPRPLPSKFVLRRIEQFFCSSTTTAREKEVVLEGMTLKLLDLQDIYSRHVTAKSEVWALKHRQPFRAGIQGGPQDNFLDVLRQSSAQFHFVAYGPGVDVLSCVETLNVDPHEFPAFYSLCALRAKVLSMTDEPRLADKLKAWCIPKDNKALAFDCGIGDVSDGIIADLDAPSEEINPGLLGVGSQNCDVFFETLANPSRLQTSEDFRREPKTIWVPQPATVRRNVILKLRTIAAKQKERLLQEILPKDTYKQDFKLCLPDRLPNLFPSA